MIFPIAALAILWLLLSRSNLMPKLAPGVLEKTASVALVLASFAALLHGNVWGALALFGVGLWLLGRASRWTLPGVTKTQTTVSRVRSATIEMDYDHSNGRMSGQVIAGPFEGHVLDALDRGSCDTLYGLCRRSDPDGSRLLEAYLDRRFPGWRPAGDGHGDAGEGRARYTSRMSEDEAYEVLGLRRGAPRDDVVRAHRTVMKKWHPDQGGTSDLAARANEAKEVLLRRRA